MSFEAVLVIAIVAFAILYFVVPLALGSVVKYRGKRLVTCPETRQPAAVDVDVKHVAMSAVVGSPDVRLKDCSRWSEHPELHDCGQECLLQIELAPEDCR